MSVSATFDFDPAEHYRASREVTRRTPARFFPWVFVALALVMAAWNIVPHWDEATASELAVASLPWLLLALFWAGLLPFLQRRASRRLPKVDASLEGPQTRIVDAAGYHSRGNGVALDVPWHAMVRGTESAHFFLFYYNKQCAYYLPKRALQQEDAVVIRALMREYLGPRAEILAT